VLPELSLACLFRRKISLAKQEMKRILEVCDSSITREMITLSCRQMGFDVVESACGDEGIALFREHGPFDLVLTDLYYFDEIKEPPLSKSDCIRDGIQFVQSIRKINPHQQIAIHTSSQLESVGDLEAIPILKKGADDFLRNLKALLNRL